MVAFFTEMRCNQIRGADNNGNAIAAASLGANDAAQLLKERDIQNVKILFYKLLISVQIDEFIRTPFENYAGSIRPV